MRLGKRILKHPATTYMLACILWCYIHLIYLTARKRRDYHPDSVPYMNGEQNGLFAFWHGHILPMLPLAPPKRKMFVLSSFHRDGRLTTTVIRLFGQDTIAGSSSKGGTQALRDMLRALKSGDNVSITPDGPRGPRHVMQPGLIATAQMSGKPIIPICFAASRIRTLGTWDRFILILPFSRIVFSVGAPMLLDKSMPHEDARLMVEQRMKQQIGECDAALL